MPDHPKAPYSPEKYEEGASNDGSPPHSETVPEGSEHSSKTSKTRTDPETGEPTGGRPDTAG